MKPNIILASCWLFILTAAFRGAEKGDQLQQYLQQKDYFRLRNAFDEVQGQLKPKEKLYYQAVLDNAFNRCSESIIIIRELMSGYHKQLSRAEEIELLTVQLDNYVKTYDYRAAAGIGELLVENYQKRIDTARLSDLKNSNIIWKALAEVPAQQLIRPAATRLLWKRDKANLMNIPVSINAQTTGFVFDTGANLSTISTSYAKKLQLQMIETSFGLGSGTSITSKASLAVARSILIGGIEVRNVVFLVLPDEQLSFPQIGYVINGIIGFPVINQLGEIHIFKSGAMNIPGVPKKGSLQNLALNELVPVIALKTGTDTLAFRFDTGAKQTELFHLFYERYKKDVVDNGHPDTINRGGAGGVVKTKVYNLKNFNLYIGDKKAALTHVNVLVNPVNEQQEYYYGNIGQDLIAQFNEMVINFKYMYVDFK
jgi:predicted aspartyl protease